MGQSNVMERRTGHAQRTTCPATVARARDDMREFVSELSPAPTPECTDNAVLVVSELVTNALRHAGGLTALRLAADRTTLEVTVEDPSRAMPRERAPDLNGAGGGFGWPLVRFLARTVVVSHCPQGGKNVRAVLSR
ncbi:ATP-binding protein [Streptomyces sp. NPDC090052]|uniref:ATP-binding protein n=1 Tax=unclassified Streptomyces TaxID=2593676 RepID=UPI0022524F0F|nr:MULTISPECIES: ATP-binding protein [unclassified Streptomyces]MCX4725474.1 ATP-binding protein [Streptomyces sp. NBC_01306]WSV05157.1 ATP-binding protein [Streptomyces sp. NBC_01020]WSX43213.1 ATP-binding protein [Streptomyces sp. NBC_00963]WSX68769.1 ATP-binding protein [Streptomyces sp. NBC_00932]